MIIQKIIHNKTSEVLIILLFFILAPLTLTISAFSLYYFDKSETDPKGKIQQNISSSVKNKDYILSSAKPYPEISASIEGSDARPLLIEEYLVKNRSELIPYARFLVETADKYGLDYRLLTAIAQKESGLCRVKPPGSHNCWGWGIHSKGSLGFENYEEAIETVSKGLKEKYIDLGYVTVEQIMSKYAHADSTTWADGVIMYMNQIE